MVHGWPGSIYEFYKVIPMLTTPVDGTVFDVVAPSIPGYGFSDAPNKIGFNQIAASQLFADLMERLNYDKYVYQGGDWGSIIGQLLVRMYPERIIGFHSNFIAPPASTKLDNIVQLSAILVPKWIVGNEDAHKIAISKFSWLLEEMGYMWEQSTKPDTIAAALTDSPVGLAAYILEKFSTWAEHTQFKDGKGLTNDEVLTNIMIYWLSGNIGSSIRFYK